MQDGLSFDPFSFQQDGRTTPEVDVGVRERVHALVVALAVVGLHEGADWGLQVSRQVVGLEQDAVLERLVPALDLALSRCRAQARRVAYRLLSGRDTGRIAPRLERFGAEEAVSASRDEMTRNGEDVVGGRVQGQETLG